MTNVYINKHEIEIYILNVNNKENDKIKYKIITKNNNNNYINNFKNKFILYIL